MIELTISDVAKMTDAEVVKTASELYDVFIGTNSLDVLWNLIDKINRDDENFMTRHSFHKFMEEFSPLAAPNIKQVCVVVCRAAILAKIVKFPS